MSSAVNPYKGLRAFGEADAADFFGRDDVARALHDTLSRRRFVAVVGPSGSGKSSLVHAGLVPLLRAMGCASPRWSPATTGRCPASGTAARSPATDNARHDPR